MILSEQEMAERNRVLEAAAKKEKMSRSAADRMSNADIMNQMNKMKGEIMEKLNEIKSHLESQINDLT